MSNTAMFCGLDMLRKINEFSRPRKWILRIVLGRYAFNELVMMRNCIEEEGYYTTFDYGIEGASYNKESLRL